jgi:hypothetical protein
MVAERDEADTGWPAEADPIRGSILPLIEAIFATTHDGSVQRAAAMGELMLAVDRIRAAMRSKPSFH